MVKLNQFLLLLTPPIINKCISHFRNKRINENLIFDTYENAAKECTKDAYEEDELVNVIFKKTQKLICELNSMQEVNVSPNTMHSLTALFIPILRKTEQNNSLKVIDFGGACGAHYFQVRRLLPNSIKLKWVVVETPRMIKYAKQLETDELKFTTKISEAKNLLVEIDLLHTSGALQCVNDPTKYLEQLLDINAKWVFFGRLGLNRKNTSVITIHSSKLSWNGVGNLPEGHEDRWVKYPFSFMSEYLFLSCIKRKYKPLVSFDDITGISPVVGEEIVGYALLCEKISC